MDGGGAGGEETLCESAVELLAGVEVSKLTLETLRLILSPQAAGGFGQFA